MRAHSCSGRGATDTHSPRSSFDACSFGDDGLNTSLADCQLHGSMDGRSVKLGEMKQPGFHNSLTATEKPGQCGRGRGVSDNR